MEKEYIAALIEKIGGSLLPKETITRYLERVARTADVGFRSTKAAYYGQPISKNQFVSNKFLTKLEQAARNAHHADAAVVFANYYLAFWETDPELHREEIDAARDFIGRMRECIHRRRQFGLQTRGEDGGKE